MWTALGLHIGLVLIAMMLRFAHRAGLLRGPGTPRFMFASMPFVMLVSADTLLAAVFQPVGAVEDLYVAHPTRGWAMRPGWPGTERSVAMRINRYGFRGPEFPAQKPPCERRILFLGDSVTFGSFVEEDDLFVSRVQDLATRRGPAHRFRTINASAIAYSPWQQHDLLVTEGLKCDPDVVIQVFCLNDVMDKFHLERFGGYSRGFAPCKPSPLEWSGLYRAARTLRTRKLTSTDAELRGRLSRYSTRALLYDGATEDVRRAWRLTLYSMNRIISASRRASVPIAIVCAPHQDQLAAVPPKAAPPQNVLSAFAREHDVPFLDLLPVFRRHLADHNIEASALFLDPLHFSTAGHILAAVAIDDFLDQLGWLD